MVAITSCASLAALGLHHSGANLRAPCVLGAQLKLPGLHSQELHYCRPMHCGPLHWPELEVPGSEKETYAPACAAANCAFSPSQMDCCCLSVMGPDLRQHFWMQTSFRTSLECREVHRSLPVLRFLRGQSPSRRGGEHIIGSVWVPV